MGILVFGDKEFVGRFIGGSAFPMEIGGTALDSDSAARVLRDATDADEDVIVGFRGHEGVDFAFKMAELYRGKKFYLAPTVKATADLWARAYANKIRIVSREGIPLSVAQACHRGIATARCATSALPCSPW